MRRPATVTRQAVLAFGLALLAGCASNGANVFQQIGGLAREMMQGRTGTPPRELTRAELDRIPYATIAISFAGGPRTYLVPLADNGGYLDYVDSAGRGVVMFGNAVARTLALGADLEGVRYDPRDPVAHPRPPAQWPARIWRSYQFRLRDGAGYAITMLCTHRKATRERIVIAEITFELARMVETCANARRQVTNTYWVEEDTGFAWKSEQWIGPDLAPITVEVMRPYGG